MKCVICGKEARWKSVKYVSPVCSKCGRVEVDKLIATGEYSPDETAIIDFYEPIREERKDDNVVTNFNPKTGEILYDTKGGIIHG